MLLHAAAAADEDDGGGGGCPGNSGHCWRRVLCWEQAVQGWWGSSVDEVGLHSSLVAGT